MDQSVVTLSQWQFAITSVYHFFFVPLTLGLSVLVAIMETIYVSTGNEVYKRMTKFWGKLFIINFAMGVVTGIVQEFQFGMNWSEYSRYVGDIFGAPLAIEALLAFFLEFHLPGIMDLRLGPPGEAAAFDSHVDGGHWFEYLGLLDPGGQFVHAIPGRIYPGCRAPGDDEFLGPADQPLRVG